MSAPHTLLRSVALSAALLLLAAVPVASAAKKPVTTTTTTTSTKTTKAKAKKTTTGETTTSSAKPLVGATGKKCWSDLVKDWYSDGRIDKTYPVHCYKDALKHLPPDVKAYSDAYDVISRALSSATRGKTHVNPNALIAPPSDQTSTTKTTTTGTVPPPGNDGGGGGSATPPLGNLPGDQGASGIPVPLIVLGALALLLVAAGAAGLIVRRVQARRGGPGAAA